MLEPPEIMLSVGPYPCSKKLCLSLQYGGSIRILARFDSEACLKAFLAVAPKFSPGSVSVEELKEILKSD